ncbi:hypothetical protein Nepgr_013381 [Nepenthes gracilis]|uniref:Uncharacterized protein n=1 Tax=Nepenthes gracilis TaxID=150966 RepID=A0AAD3SHB5_NEPGR|nr:hypothetical protein Nepgr_013381 [Nepenthes gracilis]
MVTRNNHHQKRHMGRLNLKLTQGQNLNAVQLTWGASMWSQARYDDLDKKIVIHNDQFGLGLILQQLGGPI